MTAHGDGLGTTWDVMETLDTDQPHGLDYRQLNHLAKAVRKRVNKEHEDFGDSTAGGEHVPGWAKVLKRVDGTADVSGAVDATLFQGGGLVWSEGGDTLWCITGDVTTIDPTVMTLHPDRQWKGGDVTWAGAHEFDSSVDISGSVTIEGDLTVEGHILVDSSCDFSDVYADGDVSVKGTLKVATDFTLTGDMGVDGTSSFFDECDFSDVKVNGVADIMGTCTSQSAGSVDMSSDIVYKVQTAGMVMVVGAANLDFSCLIGSANPPTKLVQLAVGDAGDIVYPSFSVPKDWYWTLNSSAAGVISILWQPFGAGGCVSQ